MTWFAVCHVGSYSNANKSDKTRKGLRKEFSEVTTETGYKDRISSFIANKEVSWNIMLKRTVSTRKNRQTQQ
jgi:hypothetical protein